MKSSPRAWFAKFSILLMTYGFNPCKFDLTVMCKTTSLGCVVLTIYADDMLLTSINEVDNSTINAYLQTHFVTHDLQII